MRKERVRKDEIREGDKAVRKARSAEGSGIQLNWIFSLFGKQNVLVLTNRFDAVL